MLSAFEKDPELLELVGEGGWNPVTDLRTTLLKYVEKMDRLIPDFDKMAEKTSESWTALPPLHPPPFAESPYFPLGSPLWFASRTVSENL